jgi:hypothetical protein
MISIQCRGFRRMRNMGFLGAWLLAVGHARAGGIALNIPNLPGSFLTHEHPTAIALDSVQFTKNGFTDQRHVDSDTTALQQAYLKQFGHPENKFPTVQVLFYKPGNGERFTSWTITYPDAFLTSLQISPQGSFNRETDVFTSVKPASLKLRIYDSSNHAFDVPMDSADVADGSLVVSRTVDAQTPLIQSFLTAGTSLSADLLFYDDNSTPYDDPVTFFGMLVSSQVFDPLGGPGAPETDTFIFTDTTQAVPEPASLVLASMALTAVFCTRQQHARRSCFAQPYHLQQ